MTEDEHTPTPADARRVANRLGQIVNLGARLVIELTALADDIKEMRDPDVRIRNVPELRRIGVRRNDRASPSDYLTSDDETATRDTPQRI